MGSYAGLGLKKPLVGPAVILYFRFCPAWMDPPDENSQSAMDG